MDRNQTVSVPGVDELPDAFKTPKPKPPPPADVTEANTLTAETSVDQTALKSVGIPASSRGSATAKRGRGRPRKDGTDGPLAPHPRPKAVKKVLAKLDAVPSPSQLPMINTEARIPTSDVAPSASSNQIKSPRSTPAWQTASSQPTFRVSLPIARPSPSLQSSAAAAPAPSDLAGSGTPAADLLRSVTINKGSSTPGSSQPPVNSQAHKPSGTPRLLATPAMTVSASPKQRIHLSTGRSSVAQISERDLNLASPSRKIAQAVPAPITRLVPKKTYGAVGLVVADSAGPSRSATEPNIRKTRRPVDRAVVVISMTRRRRAVLIERGHYGEHESRVQS